MVEHSIALSAPAARGTRTHNSKGCVRLGTLTLAIAARTFSGIHQLVAHVIVAVTVVIVFRSIRMENCAFLGQKWKAVHR